MSIPEAFGTIFVTVSGGLVLWFLILELLEKER